MNIESLSKLNKIFTPNKPVRDRSIFAGRTSQISKCVQISGTPGQGGIVYGDRGIGKTSLINIAGIIIESDSDRVIMISCKSGQSLRDVFLSVMRKIKTKWMTETWLADNNVKSGEQSLATAIENVEDKLDIGMISYTLENTEKRICIVLDEFDRLGVQFDKRGLADIIKHCSDHNENVTFFLVGVAQDINQLFSEHESTSRCLTEIRLDPMNTDEIRLIIKNGFSELDLTISEKTTSQIVQFCDGYPYYAHLLGYHIAYQAIITNNSTIQSRDIDKGIAEALQDAQERLRNNYELAVHATKTSMFRNVLFACGDVELDENSSFQPRDLIDLLRDITGTTHYTTKFGWHLGQLCNQSRGAVLKKGAAKRGRYKFSDPLMRPFIRMKRHNARQGL